MIVVSENEIHVHLRARMVQRGIVKEEIERVLNDGWNADDAVEGTFGKVFVFAVRGQWQGKYFEEKEVTVYYKYVEKQLVLLTAKARYGMTFQRKEEP